jgi:hypothetical protein
MLLAFCDAGLLLQIFAVSTCIQTTAANNAARTSESKCAFGSGQIDFGRLLARAQKGDAAAQFWSAVAFEQGRCGTLTEALKWYKLSAAPDNADAESSLGKPYEDGRSVKQDYVLAAAWYRNAGGAGQVETTWFGSICRVGASQDFVLAYMWFHLARSEFGCRTPSAR